MSTQHQFKSPESHHRKGAGVVCTASLQRCDPACCRLSVSPFASNTSASSPQQGSKALRPFMAQNSTHLRFEISPDVEINVSQFAFILRHMISSQSKHLEHMEGFLFLSVFLSSFLFPSFVPCLYLFLISEHSPLDIQRHAQPTAHVSWDCTIANLPMSDLDSFHGI